MPLLPVSIFSRNFVLPLPHSPNTVHSDTYFLCVQYLEASIILHIFVVAPVCFFDLVWCSCFNTTHVLGSALSTADNHTTEL